MDSDLRESTVECRIGYNLFKQRRIFILRVIRFQNAEVGANVAALPPVRLKFNLICANQEKQFG